MSEMGQKHESPRRSIDVRFALNKQTPTGRVPCDAKEKLLVAVIRPFWIGDLSAAMPGFPPRNMPQGQDQHWLCTGNGFDARFKPARRQKELLAMCSNVMAFTTRTKSK